MKIILVGIGGALGRAIYAISREQKVEIVAGIDAMADNLDFPVPLYKNILDCKEKADAIIDFSRPTSLQSILEYALKTKTPAVLATTGYTQEQQNSVEKASEQIAIFQSSNMSLGVNLLINLAKRATEFLGEDYEIEIIEKHHNRKVDAPSGTALSIAKELNETRNNSLNYVYGRQPESGKRERADIGIHAVRGGNIVGEHDVMFIGGEEIITLSHTAQSRSVFALGAIRASRFIKDKPAGMYNMNDIVKSFID
ncbi:MAG: 4-hydroxy-tetrahydrodipicolinate reductase [Clostridia bacterium]|nr:4-hydroxy-tetrahydrodipicolinate reductase [Clostridia bacterium]